MDELVFILKLEDKGSDTLSEFDKKLRDLKNTSEDVFSAISKTFNRLNDSVNAFGTGFVKAATEFAVGQEKARGAAKKTNEAIENEIESIARLVVVVKENKTVFEKLGASIKNVFVDTGKIIIDVGKMFTDTIGGWGKKIKDVMQMDLSAAITDKIKSVLSTDVGPMFKGFAKSVADGVTSAFKSIFTLLLDLPGKIIGAFKKIGDEIYNFGKEAVWQFAEFEDAMIGVKRVTELTDEEFGGLADSLRELSSETLRGQVSAESLAAIAEQAGMLGIEGRQAIQDFTADVAQVSVALDLSADKTSSSMAKIINQFRGSLSEVDKNIYSLGSNIGSAINVISQNTAATVDQLLSFTNRMAGTAETMGMTVDQTIALSGVMGDVGLSAERGARSMNSIMMQMLTDTDGVADAFEISAGRLKRAVEKDPLQALEMLFKGMERLKKTEGPDALARAIEGTFGKGDALKETLLKLAGSQDILTEASKKSAEAFKEGTSVTDEFMASSKSLMAIWDGIKTIWDNIYSAIGEVLEPIVKIASEFFLELSQDIFGVSNSIHKELAPAIKEFTEKYLKPAFEWLHEEIKKAWDFIKQKVNEFSPIWDKFKNNLTEKGLWESLKVLASDTFKFFEESAREAWERIKAAATEAWGKIKEILLSAIGQESVNNIENFAKSAIKAFESVAASLRELADLARTFNDMMSGFGDDLDIAEQQRQLDESIDQYRKQKEAETQADEKIKDMTDSTGDLSDATEKQGDIAYGNSVYPDMSRWIQQNIDDTAALGAEIDRVTQKLEAYSNYTRLPSTSAANMISTQQTKRDLEDYLGALNRAVAGTSKTGDGQIVTEPITNVSSFMGGSASSAFGGSTTTEDNSTKTSNLSNDYSINVNVGEGSLLDESGLRNLTSTISYLMKEQEETIISKSMAAY